MSEITNRAQELLAGRIASVEELERRHGDAVRLRQELHSAEREVANAWTAATVAGWTPTELKSLGFTQPNSRRGGRRPAKRSSTVTDAV